MVPYPRGAAGITADGWTEDTAGAETRAGHVVERTSALLGVLATVSLVLAAVPASMLAEILGGKGPLSFVMVLVVASVALISAFVAYPLAAVLRDLGAGWHCCATRWRSGARWW